jgi:hypothetical protein
MTLALQEDQAKRFTEFWADRPDPASLGRVRAKM